MPAVAVRESQTGYPRPRYRRPRDIEAEAGVAPPRSATSNGQRAAGGAPRPSNPPLSEATLSHLWAGQRFPASALVTRQGAPLRVLRPGRRGRGPGPDFRDALIAAPSGRLLRGDVELHVFSKDFRRHGHHRDARYNGVVLHVVFEDDDARETSLASGRRVPVVSLARWMRRRADELAAWLAAPLLWREPCHDAVARLGREGVEEVLERLGDLRFRERAASFTENINRYSAPEALYRALLEGVGYGGERTLLVAERLSWQELTVRLASVEGSGVRAEALLLGIEELLPSQRGAPAAGAHESALEQHWQESGLASSGGEPPTPAISPRRPANHPARRLAGVARLLARHRDVLEGRASSAQHVAQSTPELIAAWTVEASGYWYRHIAPGVAPKAPGIAAKRSPGALIGRSRAIELLTNAVLPWAAAVAEARGESPAAATSCFHELPRPGRYGALASLEANLKQSGVPLPVNARRQQGLLALYKTECTEGGCGRCPLS